MPTIPNPADIQFSYVPIFGDAGLDIRFALIGGFSTIESLRHTDRGRLYGKISTMSPGYTDVIVSLHSSYDRSNGSTMAAGIVPRASLGIDWVDIDYLGASANFAGGQAGSGMFGRMKIANLPGYGGGTARTWKFLAVPTFAVDKDVSPDVTNLQGFPGYDGQWGLAAYHALAMREIMTVGLPSRIPHLFGDIGMAGIVPMEESELKIPDMRRLASVDALRVAQADLVKSLAAEQMEHQQEWRDIAAAARGRYAARMDELGLANAPAEETATEDDTNNPSVSFGTFRRA